MNYPTQLHLVGYLHKLYDDAWNHGRQVYNKCFELKVDFCVSEKYTRGVSAVESILTLDRLRQNVAVKELLQAQGQPLIRKTASVPNFSQVRCEILSAELCILFPSGM